MIDLSDWNKMGEEARLKFCEELVGLFGLWERGADMHFVDVAMALQDAVSHARKTLDGE